jgi:hypothetical protein
MSHEALASLVTRIIWKSWKHSGIRPVIANGTCTRPTLDSGKILRDAALDGEPIEIRADHKADGSAILHLGFRTKGKAYSRRLNTVPCARDPQKHKKTRVIAKGRKRTKINRHQDFRPRCPTGPVSCNTEDRSQCVSQRSSRVDAVGRRSGRDFGKLPESRNILHCRLAESRSIYQSIQH